jgi:hypothetical protein
MPRITRPPDSASSVENALVQFFEVLDQPVMRSQILFRDLCRPRAAGNRVNRRARQMLKGSLISLQRGKQRPEERSRLQSRTDAHDRNVGYISERLLRNVPPLQPLDNHAIESEGELRDRIQDPMKGIELHASEDAVTQRHHRRGSRLAAE